MDAKAIGPRGKGFARLKFEQMRAGMVRDLMAPGNRPLPERKDGDFALDLGSASPAGGQ